MILQINQLLQLVKKSWFSSSISLYSLGEEFYTVYIKMLRVIPLIHVLS